MSFVTVKCGMSLELILHYKLKEVMNSYVCFFFCLENQKNYECDRDLDQMICIKSFFFIRIYACT